MWVSFKKKSEKLKSYVVDFFFAKTLQKSIFNVQICIAVFFLVHNYYFVIRVFKKIEDYGYGSSSVLG